MPVRTNSSVGSTSKRRPVNPHLLTRAEAADYIGVSVSALAHWAMEGRGPVYRVLGRSSYYHAVDLEAWSASRAGLRRSAW